MLSSRKRILVEFGDCDPVGIVFNPRYFAWFDASVHGLLRGAGLTLHQLIADYGIDGFPIVETKTKFFVPSRYGDEVVVETTVTKIYRCAFDLHHRLLKGDVLAVEAFETRVWTAMNENEGRVRAEPLPPEIVEILSGDQPVFRSDRKADAAISTKVAHCSECKIALEPTSLFPGHEFCGPDCPRRPARVG